MNITHAENESKIHVKECQVIYSTITKLFPVVYGSCTDSAYTLAINVAKSLPELILVCIT